ncbi:hypothetical protein [Bacillus xiapuensis]|uniref:Uncharacterized protein n=1 Tax=Bacillus xiapuensis TaxID=2014075 RepID=A0ABU6N880_9BACI|nr:hypothetical protein [Bacillus xiapuensis]
MATEYDVIFDKFIKKLKGDKQFFNYGNDLLDTDIDELVDQHLVSLLNRAIDKLYEQGLPDIDFYDKDDLLQSFNEDLTPQEIALLTDLMYLSYFEEDRNKLKAMGLFFRTSEINLFSPANERKSYMDMLSEIESSVLNSVTNYLSRDRKTWQYKSIYGGN